MHTTTYTLFRKCDDGDEEVAARNLTAGRAVEFAIEHSGEWRATMMRTDSSTFRIFELRRRATRTSAIDAIVDVIVPRTAELADDVVAAVTLIEADFLRRPWIYWDGRIEADGDLQLATAERIA